MRSLALVVLLSSTTAAAADPWAAFEPLLGEWHGEGKGAPGSGTGDFSFERALQGKVVVRRSFAEYPAMKDRPASPLLSAPRAVLRPM